MSRAQIAWDRRLSDHDGLASRGLSDEEIVRYFAPSEVKALEGEAVHEHLRLAIRSALVYINERCVEGTCRTGYCPGGQAEPGVPGQAVRDPKAMISIVAGVDRTLGAVQGIVNGIGTSDYQANVTLGPFLPCRQPFGLQPC